MPKQAAGRGRREKRPFRWGWGRERREKWVEDTTLRANLVEDTTLRAMVHKSTSNSGRQLSAAGVSFPKSNIPGADLADPASPIGPTTPPPGKLPERGTFFSFLEKHDRNPTAGFPTLASECRLPVPDTHSAQPKSSSSKQRRKRSRVGRRKDKQ